MKNYIFLVLIFIVGYCMIQSTEASEIQIPDTAIRLRVIASSNSTRDQEVKLKVKSKLESQAYKLLDGVTSIDLARRIISDNLDNIEAEIQGVFFSSRSRDTK